MAQRSDARESARARPVAAEGGGDAEDAPKLKFRNYQPKADELKDGVMPQVKVSADKELEKMGAVDSAPAPAPPTRSVPALPRDACRQLLLALASALAQRCKPCMRAQVQTKAEIQLDVAPKKANWDLKQHIAKKLEKLERRTQQAIVELIKEKVSQDGDAEEQGRLLAAGVKGKA